MTKKDYELIAKPFNLEITKRLVLMNEVKYSDKEQYNKLDNEVSTLVVFADKLATELKAENREFDYDKFQNVAGILNNPFHDELAR